MLVSLLISGEISLLINPRYKWLVGVSIMILFIFGLVQLWQLKGKELHRLGVSSYLIVLFPLFLFIFVPPKVLDASDADKKGVIYSKPKVQQTVSEQMIPSEDPYLKVLTQLKKQKEIVITDKNYGDIINTISLHPKSLVGKKIRVMGFVYRDETISKNQFVVGRYSVTCCVADSQVVGYLANWGKQDQLKLDQWVEITGKLGVIKTEDNIDQPLIYIQQVKKIKELKEPYVYFF
jgi:putative membrane protein